MKLFQFGYSPYAAKVRFALNALRRECEIVEVPYVDRKALVAATGGVGIPVLVDGATVISDSPRIVAHLDVQGVLRREPLSVTAEQWSDGPLEDAAFRFACPGLEDRMGADQGEEARLMFRLVKERKYGAGALAQWRADEATHRAQTIELLGPIQTQLSKTPFVFGANVSVADLAIAGQLFMVEVAKPGFVGDALPGMVGWYEKVTKVTKSA